MWRFQKEMGEVRRLLQRTYSTICIDPPWPESGGGKSKRGADRHYPLLPVKKIPLVIQASGVFNPAPDAHLYLWVTNTHLMDGGWVMEQLGFRYITCVTWVKMGKKTGLGQYFRQKTEQLLFGVRGDGYAVRTDDRYVIGLIEAGRRGHSVKPQRAYDLIERRSKGCYLEMFARQQRPGWDVWGHEVQDAAETRTHDVGQDPVGPHKSETA